MHRTGSSKSKRDMEATAAATLDPSDSNAKNASPRASRHLTVLLWKNWLFVRRHKLVTFCEIFSPLGVFFILLVFRQVGEKPKFLPDCHGWQHSLPSMGLNSQLQSMMCQFRAVCREKPEPAVDFDNRFLADRDLLVLINELISLKEDKLSLKQLISHLENLKILLSPDLINNTSQWNCTTGMLKKMFNFADPADLIAFAEEICNLTVTKRTDLLLKFYAEAVLGMDSLRRETESVRSGRKLASRVVEAVMLVVDVFEGRRSQADLSTVICGTEKAEDNDLGILLSTIDAQNFSSYTHTCEQINTMLQNLPIVKDMVRRIWTNFFGEIVLFPDNEITKELSRRLDNRRLWLSQLKTVLTGLVGKLGEHAIEIAILLHGILDQCKLPECRRLLQVLTERKNMQILTDNAKRFADKMLSFTKCLQFQQTRILDDKIAFENYLMTGGQNVNFSAGIALSNQSVGEDGALSMNFSIRMLSSRVDDTTGFTVLDKYWHPQPRAEKSSDIRYVTSGFLDLQDIVEQTVLEHQFNASRPLLSPAVGRKLKPFPHTCYHSDADMWPVIYQLPLFLIIAWVFLVMMLVHKVVSEKESHVKMFTQAMGVGRMTHWLSWFIYATAITSMAVLSLTMALKIGQILPHSNPLLVMLLLQCYMWATITQCFLLSTFFHKANLAASTMSIVYLVLYLPAIALLERRTEASLIAKFILSLLSQVSFAVAASRVAQLEHQGVGLTVASVGQSTIAGSLLMLILNTFLHLAVAFYVEEVSPGPDGIPKPYNFFLRRSYWKTTAPDRFTDGDTAHSSAVSTHNLTKRHKGAEKPAINNISVDFHDGRINSLLGHNGAGKSTIISLLTGMIPPTSGSISIFGRDLQEDMEYVRKNMGFCPQYNVLFEYMTVPEHLYLIAKLRSDISDQRIKQQSEKYMVELGMTGVAKLETGKLSGGQKRKLCLAMAFLGDTKLVILDEPTAGVDTVSGFRINRMILSEKKHRTIILATHQMQEAENLSDYVLILHGGEVVAHETNVGLRNKHGNRLCFTVEFEDAAKNGAPRLIDLMNEYDPCAKLSLLSYHSVEIAMRRLPFKDLENLCKTLEEQKCQLNVASFRLTSTSLEDVFLDLAPPTTPQLTKPTLRETTKLWKTGENIKFNVIRAMFVKRWHHSRRSYLQLTIQLVLPLLVMISTLSVKRLAFTTSILPPMPLDPWLMMQHRPSSPMQLFVSLRDKRDSALDAVFQRSMSHFGLVGNQASDWTATALSHPPNCSCAERLNSSCNVTLDQARHRVLPNGDKLYDLTDMDIANYLLSTQHLARTTRYGGFEFVRSPNSELVDKIRSHANKSLLARTMNLLLDNDSAKWFSALLDLVLQSLPPPNQVRIWYNNKGYVAAPAFLNLHSQMLAKGNLTAASHPYKDVRVNQAGHLDERSLMLCATPIFGCFIALAFACSCCLFFHSMENGTGAKHLQLVSGLSRRVLWTCNFAWDLCIYTVTVSMLMVVIQVFGNAEFSQTDSVSALLATLLLYGMSLLPATYALSFFFKSPALAFVCAVVANILAGVSTLFVRVLLEMLDARDVTKDIVRGVFSVTPHFCLGNALFSLATRKFKHSVQQRMTEYGTLHLLPDKYRLNPSAFQDIRVELAAFVAQFFLHSAILAILEGRFTLPCRLLTVAKPSAESISLCTNPSCSSKLNEKPLLVKNLKKHFPGRSTYTVKEASFHVDRGECFGMLGLNGAGKTTIFRMLTGHLPVEEGDAFICGVSVRKQFSKAQAHIGYCPQFDSLHGKLTSRELLTFYCRLRGIPRGEIHDLVSDQLQRFRLSQHENIISQQYSGGNRRKLSVAVAFLGRPKLVFLDEPTASVDPSTKRFIWTIIRDALTTGTSVLMTSHSLQECELLCRRMMILVEGQIKCMGTLDQLQQQYGGGYTINLTLTGMASEGVVKDIAETYGATLVSALEPHILFKFGRNISLSSMMSMLSRLRRDAIICETFTLKPTGLEDIFHTLDQNDSIEVLSQI